MADSVGIRVEGLKELRRELRRLEMHKDLQPVNKEAAEVAASRARELGLRSFTNLAGGVSRLGSRGVASIRATATQSKGYVRGGKAGTPYYGGMDFGSAGRYRQFGPKKSEGRFIYLAIAEKGPEIVDLYEKRIDQLTSRAFPDGKLGR